MITANLSGNDNLDFQSGFEEGEEKRLGKRLRNRKALMEIANSAADQGKVLGVDEWASQVNELLGPSAFLSTTAPSQDALNVMLAEQNKRAATVAEKKRREQFASDQQEKSAILADVHDQYLAGKTPAETLQYAQERYGQELLGRLNLNFDQEQQKALFKATTEAKEQGAKLFSTVEEASDFVKQNDWLPQVKKDSLLAGAQLAQTQNESLVMKEALNRGGTMGWIDNEVERESMRNTIRTLLPKASKEYEEQLLNKALSAARSANQNIVTSNQTKWNDEVRRAEAVAAPQNDRVMLEMEEKDKAFRQQTSSSLSKAFASVIDRQTAEAETYVSKGKPVKGVGVDPEKAMVISNGLRTHVFESTADFIAAVKSGDKDKIRAVMAAATPIEQHLAKADALGRLITGSFNTVGDAVAALQQSGLGISKESAAKLGREIKLQRAIAADAAKSENKPKSYSGWGGGMDGDPFGLAPQGNTFDSSKSKIAQAAALNASDMETKFIKQSAGDIKGMREALRQNGRVGATPEDLQQYEFGIAMDRARALLSGMGVNDKDAEISMARRILAEAGPSISLTRQPSAAERLQGMTDERRKQYQLNPQTGALPGASLSSPRLNQSFR